MRTRNSTRNASKICACDENSHAPLQSIVLATLLAVRQSRQSAAPATKCGAQTAPVAILALRLRCSGVSQSARKVLNRCACCEMEQRAPTRCAWHEKFVCDTSSKPNCDQSVAPTPKSKFDNPRRGEKAAKCSPYSKYPLFSGYHVDPSFPW